MGVIEVTAPDPRPLPEVADDDARISITDTGGSVAKLTMSYSPPSGGTHKRKFGPPVRSRVPSALYLLASILFGAFTLYAYSASTGSAAFRWAVEGDRIRPISASAIAAILLVSAVATVIRTNMRGVVVGDDWIEARYLLMLGIPKARRWGWPQVTRVVVDGHDVGLELYDGTFERLPEVADGDGLVRLIAYHALRRHIDVTSLGATSTPS